MKSGLEIAIIYKLPTLNGTLFRGVIPIDNAIAMLASSSGAIIFCQREGGKSALLEHLLFSPVALWLSQALIRQGVERFFVVCHADDREAASACFPQGSEVVTDGTEDASERLTAFLSASEGRVTVITKPVALLPATSFQGPMPRWDRSTSGLYQIEADALSQALGEGDVFDAILQTHGVQSGMTHLIPLERYNQNWVLAETALRQEAANTLIGAGVRVMDPNSIYIDPLVTVGEGTVLLPGTILRGHTTIGSHCEIGPNSMILDCTIGAGVTINASQLIESTVEDGAKIGPFAYIRPHCHVGRDVKVGDFVELKNSVIGDGTKISHLTYVGDSDVGRHVNFGCGTVTVNYDGAAKFRTAIGDSAFIGCNTNLVAPVRVGEGAYTAAGSTITDDVPPDSLAIARSQQVVKKQWAAKRRVKRGK